MKKKKIPASKDFKVEIKFSLMKGLGGGFRSEWISTKGDGEFEAGVDSGAGLGNGYLTYWIEEKGKKRVYYTTDIGDVLLQAIEQTRG